MEQHPGSSKTHQMILEETPWNAGSNAWLEHAIGEPDKLAYYVLRLSCMSPVNMGSSR